VKYHFWKGLQFAWITSFFQKWIVTINRFYNLADIRQSHWLFNNWRTGLPYCDRSARFRPTNRPNIIVETCKVIKKFNRHIWSENWHVVKAQAVHRTRSGVDETSLKTQRTFVFPLPHPLCGTQCHRTCKHVQLLHRSRKIVKRGCFIRLFEQCPSRYVRLGTLYLSALVPRGTFHNRRPVNPHWRRAQIFFYFFSVRPSWRWHPIGLYHNFIK